jgi:chromosome segregation ATPase
VLYLAEVKKQTKGFIGGAKTALKLLACQHNDQTWSAIPGDETLACDEIAQAGEGALVLVNLSNNRQIQGKPELAGIELVRQLQKLSRLLEKTKEQQEEIDQWKQSLSIQSEELTRRQMDMEARLEQIDQMQEEFEELERQRQEMEANWECFRGEQQRMEALQKQIGPIDWNSPQVDKVQAIIGRLFANPDRATSVETQIQSAREALERQQTLLNNHLQQLEQEKANLGQRQNDVNQQGEAIKTRKQELESVVSALEGSKIQLQVRESLLASKQELLGRVNLEIGATEDLKKILTGAGDTQSKQQVDVRALENMPLGELQETVKNLQADFDKLVRFVNDQEEELTLQCQAVAELEETLKTANDYDRFNLESELAEEQERKKMLDETLFGQRRRLKERQAILSQHLKVLRRRQGVMEIEDNLQQINLEPILLQLKDKKRNAQQDRQRLEKEIEQLQSSIEELRQQIARQESDRAAKMQELQRQEENWEQAKAALTELQSRVKLYEKALSPLQGNLAESRQKVEEVAQLFSSVEQPQAIA